MRWTFPIKMINSNMINRTGYHPQILGCDSPYLPEMTSYNCSIPCPTKAWLASNPKLALVPWGSCCGSVVPVTTGAALPCSTVADALRGNDPTHQPFSMHNRTLTRARNRTPITLRFEPAAFWDGNAQSPLWKRCCRLTTLATAINWDFSCRNSLDSTNNETLSHSRGGI